MEFFPDMTPGDHLLYYDLERLAGGVKAILWRILWRVILHRTPHEEMQERAVSLLRVVRL